MIAYLTFIYATPFICTMLANQYSNSVDKKILAS